MESLSIILPAYNEALRLPRTFELIAEAKKNGVFSSINLVEVWVIDDGSQDETSKVAQYALALLPELKVRRVTPNEGKGNAIHEGLKQACGDWCLIADADSATPWNQFQKLLSAAKTAVPPAAIAIGSRDLPDSDIQTKQSWIRENMGKTFNLLVRLITGLPFKDTQCGFKLIRRSAIQSFLNQLQVKRFAWDVEFLMFAQAHQLKIMEVAVAWAHQDASRVNPIKDSSEMLFRVLQLRFRLLFSRSTSR